MGTSQKPNFCEECPLFVEGEFVPPTCDCTICRGGGLETALRVLVEGAQCEAKMLIIGMAGGAEEVRQQKVLCGPSGRVLNVALSLADYQEPTRRLNLVQCRTSRPGAGPHLVNRDPLKREVDYCRQHFLDPELRTFQERGGLVVVLLGSLVYTHVAGDSQGSFAQARGHRFTGEMGKIRFPISDYVKELEPSD